MDIIGTAENSPQTLAASQAIGEAVKARVVMKDYSYAVRQVCKQFHRHGLGQALAYMQLRSSDRPGSPYNLLARQLDVWLPTALGVSARSALAAIASQDSRFYLEASEQAWLFLWAVRQELEKSS